MSKTTIIIIGIIVLCFGGLLAWSITDSQTNSTNFDDYDSATIIPATIDNGQIGDHVRGKIDSPVIFIEYADFQCPGCAAMHPTINVLYEEYKDRVAFAFRHFPIPSLHPNAKASAAAAEAAGLQGYFFEMMNALFANQAVWSYTSGAERTNVFVELFLQISPNGDANQFRSDMSKSEVTKKISFDYNLGVKKDSISGTPSFFVNGEHISSSGTSSTEILAAMRERLNSRLIEFGLPVDTTETDQTEE